jgi:hypothetical protein
MEDNLRRLRQFDPTNPSFAGMAIVHNLLAGREAEAGAAFDDFMRRFNSNGKTLDVLARDIGRTGHLSTLARLEGVIRDHGFDPQVVLFSRLMVQLNAQDWSGAQVTQQALAAREGKLARDLQVFQKTAGAVIELCAQGAPAARLTILEQLSRYRGRLKLYTEVMDWLVSAQRWQAAQDVLVLAEGGFPQSNQLAAFRKRLAPELVKLAEQDAARQVRVASSTDLIPDAASLFAQLDTQKSQGAIEAALELIQGITRRAPEWLPAAQGPLDERELQLAFLADNLPQLQATVRRFVRADQPQRLTEICTLARHNHAAGNKSVAQILTGEVLRRHPDHPEATSLVIAWAEAEKKANRPEAITPPSLER